ncbi:MAG TPA: baseplate J/gp47 family protein [Patescibacteria group bacterium]|nr:baseplate J/gp47 family protein [Patescibacteria group bacterium]
MAEGIVYLDVDDEITSAASRIRSAAGTTVALVVPYGSRIATSRMNFRLLSREALVSNKRLAIVSGDAGSRSLAASAGLPVFSSVGEYESSRSRPADDPGADAGTGVEPGDGPVARAAPAAPAAAAAAMAASALEASETVVVPPSRAGEAVVPPVSPAPPVPPRKSQRPKRPLPDPDPTIAIAAAPPGVGDNTSPPAGTGEPDGARAIGPSPIPGGRVRAPLLAVFGLLGLAAIVVAVGVYLFLPSASIRLTPRREPIGPIAISVAADPDAATVDVANGLVPAIRLEVPVEAAQTFDTTGTHVELTPARGLVTFQSYDPTAQNTVVSGSVLSTEGGVRFRTVATVILPRATLIFPPGRIEPSSRTVPIEAVKDGTAGNVPANSIRSVPQGENPEFLKVNNPNPTEGGSRTVTPEVTKAEVDRAVAVVRADVEAAFAAAITEGAGAPDDTTLFPQTRTLGEIVLDGNPQALVGEAVETFEVRMTATGTVIAVDPSPVQAIAEARLAAAVAADQRIVDGSVDIVIGSGSVGEDGQVTFEATARAIGVAIVDPGPLRELAKGRTAVDARAALAPYGDALVTLWPDWVTTVPTIDSRLEITIVAGPPGGAPAPSSSAGSAPPSASRPEASPPPPPRSPSAAP